MNPLNDPRNDDLREFLNRWSAVAPALNSKQRLIEQLTARIITPRRSPRESLHWAWLIARSQTRLVHPATWIASLLVMAVGIWVTLALYRPTLAGSDLPFVLIAPLVAAVGVAFLYGIENDPPLELQLSTPVSPRVILLARLALLFGFNLILGLVCSIALALVQSEISLMPLILAWLAPMTFLSALAFLTSVLLFDPFVSVFISLMLWASQVLRRVEVEPLALERIPDLFRAELYPLLFVVALFAVVLALWLAEREQRWTTVN